jgi:hypothetical protein
VGDFPLRYKRKATDMGDFPQRRDSGMPPKASPKAPPPSSDEERAERIRLVDEWEKSQPKAPSK